MAPSPTSSGILGQAHAVTSMTKIFECPRGGYVNRAVLHISYHSVEVDRGPDLVTFRVFPPQRGTPADSEEGAVIYQMNLEPNQIISIDEMGFVEGDSVWVKSKHGNAQFNLFGEGVSGGGPH